MKRILVAFNNLQDNTITDVVFCLLEWQKYYAAHPEIEIEIYRCAKWGFEFNFNEFMRYGVENGFDYVFQYDCDMVGDKKVLEKMVAWDKECVGCLYYSRKDLKPQYWNAKGGDDGIDVFYQSGSYEVCDAIRSKSLIASDVRASGFSLFKTSALLEIGYPYGVMKKNKSVDYGIDGFDIDITWKLSRRYGAVWTDPSPELGVAHITNHHITVLDGIKYSQFMESQHGN